MKFKAFYNRRDGAVCIRSVSITEARDMLMRGRFGAKEVRIEDESRNIYGLRQLATDAGFYDVEDQRVKWLWWWDDQGCLNI